MPVPDVRVEIAPSFAGPVEASWSVDGAGGGPHRVIPDGRANVIVKVGERTRCYVAGPASTAIVVDMAAVRRTVAARLQPWALGAVGGVHGRDLRDRTLDLADVSSELAERVGHAVTEARDVDDARQRLRDALGMHRSAAVPAFVRAAVSVLDERPGQRISDLADELGVGVRRLHRAFLRWVGLPPKTYARVRRVRRAMEHRRGDGDWTRVALDGGFADQAHLCREFRRVVGLSPGEWEGVRNGQDAAVRDS